MTSHQRPIAVCLNGSAQLEPVAANFPDVNFHDCADSSVITHPPCTIRNVLGDCTQRKLWQAIDVLNKDCRRSCSAILTWVLEYVKNSPYLRRLCGKHTVLPFTGLHCGYVNRTALMNVVRRDAKPLDVFFNLPYTTHNYLVGPLSGQCSIHETLYIQTLKFIRSMLASANPFIAYLGY